MKRSFFMVLVCGALLSAGSMAFADDADNNKGDAGPSFQFMITGHLGFVSGNSDMNDFTEYSGGELSEYYNDVAQSQGEPRDWKVRDKSKADTGAGVELELRFFGESLGFGAGTGFHYTEANVTVRSPSWSNKPEYTTSLAVIPLTATVYFIKPLSQNSFMTLGAGAGYYYGFLDGNVESNDSIADDADLFEPMAESSCIGYHLKADYNYMFGPLTVTAGVMGRYVQFNSFSEDGVKYDLKAGITGVSVYAGAGIAL